MEEIVETCESCGNAYDKPMQIIVGGRAHIFDSFECAIHRLAPRCTHCGCPIIGHGMEADGRYFCGASCANATLARAGLKDRV